jgi:predicted Zn-dependent protease
MLTRMTSPVRRASCGVIALLVAVLAACATNPASGKREISLMSEAQEIAIGQQADGEVRREMGVYDDSELQRYVSDIGHRLAAASHRPNLPWTFTVVDSPAINAFALPGGYIYITRGILSYLSDEAELAGVLGHEIGHVAARHAAQQYTRATGGSLGLMALSIFVPGVRPFGDLASTGLGLLFLKYGRDDELESDRLGLEYAAGTGWDPSGVPRFLSTLSRVDAMSARGVPNWLSTHPDPASRVDDAQPVVARFSSPSATARNRDVFLRHINGVVFGDNPKDGIVRANAFLHPVMRFAIEFPEGWEVQNSPQQVAAREPGTEHYMLLQLVDRPRGRGLEDVATSSMTSAGFRREDGQPTTINGLDAFVGTYRGTLRNVGRVLVRAAHIAHARDVYFVAGFAPEAEFPAVDRAVVAALESFRELGRSEADAIRPNRLDFYDVRQGDTWQSIAARAGREIVRAAQLAIMNGYEVNVQPNAGDRIKIVVAG